jgi:hypothetical protein
MALHQMPVGGTALVCDRLCGIAAVAGNVLASKSDSVSMISNAEQLSLL